jgi:hypothetical protein
MGWARIVASFRWRPVATSMVGAGGHGLPL